jgi:hypothetical protein
MIGLPHSNENGQEYGDSTGYMSFGHLQVDWPRKCFNGLENWQLGWYQKHQVTLDNASLGTGHLIQLASFVDFNRTNKDESVVVNIADEFYIQFNTAKDFNIDTEEKQNKVTITSPSHGESEALSGLEATERYEVANFQNLPQTLVIEACKKGTNSLGADVMLMSVALDKSLCNGAAADEWARAYNALDTTTSPPIRLDGGSSSQKDPSPVSPTANNPSKSTPAVGSFFWVLFTKIYANKQTQAPSQAPSQAPKIVFHSLLKDREDKIAKQNKADGHSTLNDPPRT